MRRALTALAAAALLGGVAAPATAFDSLVCRHADSERLLTANDGEYKLWVDTYVIDGYTNYHVCFGAGAVTRGDLHLRYPLKGEVAPTVTPDLTDDLCPRLLEIQDPVQLMTRFAEGLAATPAYVCFGVADEAYRITVGPPTAQVSAELSLWLERGTTMGDLACALAPAVQCTDTLVRLHVL